jgi:hypothetical protein
MKKLQLCLLTLLILAAAACKKGELAATGNVSATEAADLVAASLSGNSSGFVSISDGASVRSQAQFDAHLACGSTRTDTVTKTSPTGAPTMYNYGFGYSLTLNCNTGNLPDNVSGKANYRGVFSNPHVSSTNTGSAIFTLAGLTTNARAYVFNGSLLRSGSFASKSDTSNHGSSHLDIEIHNLTLHKPDRAIASGTATVTISGIVPTKGNFSYNGTLVFNGDGTAKFTVNGAAYLIDLTTGEKTKA